MAVIGVQTNGITQLYGVDGAYRVMKEAGFDAADVSLNSLLSYQDIMQQRKTPAFQDTLEAGLSCFLPYREAAEKYGVQNAQAHAPYPSYVKDFDGTGDYNEYLMRAMEISIAASACIGCGKLVIHPFFNQYGQAMTEAEEERFNLNRFARLIPTAKRYGVTILLENMFVRNNGKIYQAVCSDFAAAARMIDALNGLAGEERFGFCLDTGHALLLGKDIRRAMNTLGSRIQAFHIHDNNGIDDQHLAPYMGVGDWNRFVEGLRDIHYQGHLSFETYRAITRAFDPELAPEVLRLIAKTGKMFAERAGIKG